APHLGARFPVAHAAAWLDATARGRSDPPGRAGRAAARRVLRAPPPHGLAVAVRDRHDRVALPGPPARGPLRGRALAARCVRAGALGQRALRADTLAARSACQTDGRSGVIVTGGSAC